jgi:hypothetical protein
MRFLVSGTSGTFRYDPAKDELYDPYYRETFRRTADTRSSAPPAPVINLTPNAEQKVFRLGDFRPFFGKIFLIVTITLRNIHGREGYSLDDRDLHVVFDNKPGISSENVELGGPLQHPLPFGTIAPKEMRQGDVIFAVPKSSRTYTLKPLTAVGTMFQTWLPLRTVQHDSGLMTGSGEPVVGYSHFFRRGYPSSPQVFRPDPTLGHSRSPLAFKSDRR